MSEDFNLSDRKVPELSEEDIEAIAESDAQCERGEIVDFREFAAEMWKKYGDGSPRC